MIVTITSTDFGGGQSFVKAWVRAVVFQVFGMGQVVKYY